MQQVAKEAINSKKLSELVVQGMLEKKASDVVVMDLREVKNAIADFFVLCSGNSDTQIDAISDSIEEQVHKHSQQNPWRREGKENNEWIIIDYVDVVAHVFNKDKRAFYALEELWGDAKITRFDSEN
ncbi:ribosome silencing factor [Marinoscillum furvescens]|uniref:Ribosomal silencing factor RsfS n=1 Tax=Marinoscillum furvescens DSM 4134 TaxID=1122208 RepID=A0A3D9L3A2_MARFU|nr:ribosome silencing factor [Marinoscillum furvescens]RED99523.1 ribosome-associated protein [Marinoscillum furvescens DSM 4134]